MPRPPRRAKLLVPLLAVLVAGTVGLAGFELFAGSRLADAGRWIDRTQEWQMVLLATAEGIEDESLKPAEGGGYALPWEPEGTHPFPISPSDVVDALHGMTMAFPLALDDHDDAARRVVESHDVLRQQLQGIERLGPLANLTGLPPVLRSAAIDTGALMRPVYRLVGTEAEESGVAALLLAAAALACAAVVVALSVYAFRAGRQRDRMERHVDALRSSHRTPAD